MATKKSISLDNATLAALTRRGGDNLSGNIQLLVHAYTDACRIGFNTVRRALTRAEAKLILDCMNSTVKIMLGMSVEHWITGGTAGDGRQVISGIAHNVTDAIELDGLDKKWEVDGRALIDKLTQFDRLANLALLDWCQVMWDNCYTEGFWDAELKKFPE